MGVSAWRYGFMFDYPRSGGGGLCAPVPAELASTASAHRRSARMCSLSANDSAPLMITGFAHDVT